MYDYDGWLVGWTYDIEQAEISAIQAHYAVDNARMYYDDNDESRALNSIITAGERWDDVWDRLLYGWTQSSGFWRIISLVDGIHTDFDELCNGDPYELTLIKMIEAYIAADDDHRSAHRLLLDAYQASMYDKPFDKEYHAAWIRRFRSWA